MRLPFLLLSLILSPALGAAAEPPLKGNPLTEVKVPDEGAREDDPLPDGAVARFGRVRDRRNLEGGLVAMSDGKHLVAAFPDHYVRMWEADGGRLVQTFPLRELKVNAVAAGEKETTIAVGWSEIIYILRASQLDGTMTRINDHRLNGDVRGLAFSPDDKLLASVGQSGELVLINAIRNGAARKVVATAPADTLKSVAFTRDSKGVLTLSSAGVTRFWKVENLKLVREFETPRGADSLHVLPDGKSAAIFGEEGIVFWDIGTGEITRRLEKFKGRGAFSPDGRWLASAAVGSTASPVITLYDLKENREAFTLPGHVGGTLHFTFSPDLRTLHTYGHDRMVRHWSLTGHREVNPPSGHAGRVTGAAFADRGATVVSCSQDGSVRFWDVATGKEVRRLTAKDEYLRALALAPDRRTLAISGSPQPLPVDVLEDCPQRESSRLHFWDLKNKCQLYDRVLDGQAARGGGVHPGRCGSHGDER